MCTHIIISIQNTKKKKHKIVSEYLTYFVCNILFLHRYGSQKLSRGCDEVHIFWKIKNFGQGKYRRIVDILFDLEQWTNVIAIKRSLHRIRAWCTIIIIYTLFLPYCCMHAVQFKIHEIVCYAFAEYLISFEIKLSIVSRYRLIIVNIITYI